MDTPSLTVGWVCPKEKKVDFFSAFSSFCTAHHVRLIRVDLDQPWEDQGPFDVLFHKVTYYEVQPGGAEKVDRLEEYTRLHGIPVVDSIAGVRRMVDRVALCDLLQTMKIPGVCTPRHTLVATRDDLDQLQSTSLHFPLLMKSTQACGTPEAHSMKILFDPNHLTDIPLPYLVQEFVNHGGMVVKVYVADGQVFPVCKPSIPDQPQGDVQTAVVFHSGKIHEWERMTGRAASRPAAEAPSVPCRETLQHIASALGRTLDLSLFGFDLVVETHSGDCYIVDVNYFPGYVGVPGFFDIVLQRLFSVAGKTPPPCSS